MRVENGSLRLFRLFGINVFLHWSWGLVAAAQLLTRRNTYERPAWKVIEYLVLFGLVLMHEFGHALACRSVGGRAERILLWPLGGVAFVDPPARPGAFLWSLVAGPLVNLVLLPLFVGLGVVGRLSGSADIAQFTQALLGMDIVLLVFNLLPIYPLDGGKILQAVLWYFVGPIRSLLFATAVGMVGCVVGGLAALVAAHDTWLVIIALFGAQRCYQAWKRARHWAAQAHGSVTLENSK